MAEDEKSYWANQTMLRHQDSETTMVFELSVSSGNFQGYTGTQMPRTREIGFNLSVKF
jgi:hypothetical protein